MDVLTDTAKKSGVDPEIVMATGATRLEKDENQNMQQEVGDGV